MFKLCDQQSRFDRHVSMGRLLRNSAAALGYGMVAFAPNYGEDSKQNSSVRFTRDAPDKRYGERGMMTVRLRQRLR